MPPFNTKTTTPMFGGDKDILPILQTQEKELKSKLPSILGSKISSPTKDFNTFLSTGDETFKNKATRSLGILQEAVTKGATQFLFGKEFPTISDGAKDYLSQTKNLVTKTTEATKKSYQKMGTDISMFTGETITHEEKLKEMQDMALNFSPMGMAKVVKPIIAGAVKEAPSVFQGFKDLSTKVLEDLKGRSTVSKQYIQDATNRPELKDSERNVIRQVLDTMQGDKLNVKDFADRVKAELLPLVRNDAKTGKNINTGELTGRYRYESIVLPSEIRGNVSKYSENVYESPIQTSAGGTHYPQYKNYAGHTRVEDMADKSTRRVIEVQSDLYQKGGLEREITAEAHRPTVQQMFGENDPPAAEFIDAVTKNTTPLEIIQNYKLQPDFFTLQKIKDEILYISEAADSTEAKPLQDLLDELLKMKNVDFLRALRVKEVDKLQQYNDPTAHFRMVREEIKKAAQDGKTKLQFPTGETAMKIEGLGENGSWMRPYQEELADTDLSDLMNAGMYDNIDISTKLNIGDVVVQGANDYPVDWVVTEVLGDGKFKAVSRVSVSDDNGKVIDRLIKKAKDAGHDESFDISGKVDTNDPIYKFYEKEVGKFLKKFDAKFVTDKQGVSWWEMPLTKEHATEPVQAFGKAKVGTILGGAAATGAVASMFTGSKVSAENSPEMFKEKKLKPLEGSWKGTNYDPIDVTQNRPNAKKETIGIGAGGVKIDDSMVAVPRQKDGETGMLRMGTVIYVPSLDKKFLVADLKSSKFNGLKQIDFATTGTSSQISPKHNQDFSDIVIVREGKGREDLRNYVKSGEWKKEKSSIFNK